MQTKSMRSITFINIGEHAQHRWQLWDIFLKQTPARAWEEQCVWSTVTPLVVKKKAYKFDDKFIHLLQSSLFTSWNKNPSLDCLASAEFKLKCERFVAPGHVENIHDFCCWLFASQLSGSVVWPMPWIRSHAGLWQRAVLGQMVRGRTIFYRHRSCF